MAPPARSSMSSKPSSGGGMTAADKKKVIGASVMLVLAGLLIAWSMGMFDGVISKPPTLPPAEAQKLSEDVKKAVEEKERLEKSPNPPQTAGS
jgi:hypothetical protein